MLAAEQSNEQDTPVEPAARAKKPRVLFVNRSYWPDVEATGQLLTELCEDLAGDFDVHVLCGQPRKIADEADAAEFTPAKRAIRNGVTIHRIGHTQFNKASFWGRLANMLSFQVGATWRAFRVPRPDIAVTETDPPFLCLLGSQLKRWRRCRHICYLQDIYPDVAVALGVLREGWKTRYLRRRFFESYRRSDGVIVLSTDMRKFVIQEGVSADNVHVIPNWVDTDLIYPIKENNTFRRRHGLEDKYVVMYSGNMGLSQHLINVLKAAELLQHHSDIVFAFVGEGADRSNLERHAAVTRLGNVRFYDYQPLGNLAQSLSAADIHIVVLHPEVTSFLMPSKLCGILAAGTAVLALTSRSSHLAEFVLEEGVGIVAAPDDAHGIASAIVDRADLSKHVRADSITPRTAALRHFRRDEACRRVKSLLEPLGMSDAASAHLGSASVA